MANKHPGRPVDVTLTPPTGADGALIATVWSDSGQPLGERLIYREPSQHVHLNIETQSSSYVPGDRVELTLSATDDRGRPVAGVVVTDDSVLNLIGKREQAPRLPVMVLLENDVRELADAHIYLDPGHPQGPLTVDLLLGTQGWRRFAFVNTSKFLTEHGDHARRVLALRIATRRNEFWPWR